MWTDAFLKYFWYCNDMITENISNLISVKNININYLTSSYNYNTLTNNLIHSRIILVFKYIF